MSSEWCTNCARMTRFRARLPREPMDRRVYGEKRRRAQDVVMQIWVPVSAWVGGPRPVGFPAHLSGWARIPVSDVDMGKQGCPSVGGRTMVEVLVEGDGPSPQTHPQPLPCNQWQPQGPKASTSASRGTAWCSSMPNMVETVVEGQDGADCRPLPAVAPHAHPTLVGTASGMHGEAESEWALKL